MLFNNKQILSFTLESLRLNTLYCIPPAQCGNHCDPTPVEFTMATTGLPSDIKPLNMATSQLPQKITANPVLSSSFKLELPASLTVQRSSSEVSTISFASERLLEYRRVTSSEIDNDNSASLPGKSNSRRSELSFNAISVPKSARKSLFSTRCDVVYKKILRDFRRSYI
jgi:hypothetical protein